MVKDGKRGNSSLDKEEMEKPETEAKKEEKNTPKIDKQDLEYQMRLDYNGRTSPKVKVDKNKIDVTVGSKFGYNEDMVISSIKKLYPDTKIEYLGWVDYPSGGGFTNSQ